MTDVTKSMKLEKEMTIPAGKHGSFIVEKDKVCRIVCLEGEQCLDAVFLNANDYRETFHTFFSFSFNCKQGTGNAFYLKTLYSRPPWERVMMTVLEDTVKQHTLLSPGRCSPMIYRLRDKVEGHPNCQENLAEALKPYGLEAWQVPDVFNMFMNGGVDQNGMFYIHPPKSKKGDYMDLRAEMDVLCAISACPDDLAACNNFKPKPVGIRIYGPAA